MNKKTQTQLWKKINEPKVEGIITHFGNPPTKVDPPILILDRVPKITRTRKKNKKRK
jgi:hypothetical protein